MCAVVVAACGGNSSGGGDTPVTNDSVPPSADDPPPTSADDSPPSADDLPPSADDPPSGNPDTPPGGGGGGRLQRLCETACDVLAAASECADEEPLDPMVRQICENDGCAAAAAEQVDISSACLDAIEGFYACFADLSDVCMPSESEAQACLEQLEGFEACEDDSEPNPPNPMQRCTVEQGCDCPTPCAECMCFTDNDAELCADECPVPNPNP
jgi:hypothetical protein